MVNQATDSYYQKIAIYGLTIIAIYGYIDLNRTTLPPKDGALKRGQRPSKPGWVGSDRQKPKQPTAGVAPTNAA